MPPTPGRATPAFPGASDRMRRTRDSSKARGRRQPPGRPHHRPGPRGRALKSPYRPVQIVHTTIGSRSNGRRLPASFQPPFYGARSVCDLPTCRPRARGCGDEPHRQVRPRQRNVLAPPRRHRRPRADVPAISVSAGGEAWREVWVRAGRSAGGGAARVAGSCGPARWCCMKARRCRCCDGRVGMKWERRAIRVLVGTAIRVALVADDLCHSCSCFFSRRVLDSGRAA